VTVDGVRDSAQYSRTDPFNLQQIEVYNGANSVFNGSGSVGGTINLVSKTPQAETWRSSRVRSVPTIMCGPRPT
jgi:catecholate siderophore receptor